MIYGKFTTSQSRASPFLSQHFPKARWVKKWLALDWQETIGHIGMNWKYSFPPLLSCTLVKTFSIRKGRVCGHWVDEFQPFTFDCRSRLRSSAAFSAAFRVSALVGTDQRHPVSFPVVKSAVQCMPRQLPKTSVVTIHCRRFHAPILSLVLFSRHAL